MLIRFVGWLLLAVAAVCGRELPANHVAFSAMYRPSPGRLAPGTLVEFNASARPCSDRAGAYVRLHSNAFGQDFSLAVEIVPSRFGALPHPRTTAGNPVRLGQSAYANQVIVLRGSGAGRAQSADLVARLGSQPLEVLSVSRTTEPGIDEVRLRLPASLDSPGSYVPLRIGTRDRDQTTQYLPAAQEGGLCPHPLASAPGQLRSLDAGRWVALVRLVAEDFGVAKAEEVRQLLAPGPAGCELTLSTPAPAVLNLWASPLASGDETLTTPSGLNLGAGSSFSSSPGAWALQTLPGLDVLAFSAFSRVPASPKLRDYARLLAADPKRDLVLEWNGDSYDADSVLTALLEDGAPPVLVYRVTKAQPWFASRLTLAAGRAADRPQRLDIPLVNGATGAGVVERRNSATYSVRHLGDGQ